ncbi:MAG: beta-galactosidase, partial [Promethearchaeota archaeon]
MKKPIVSFNGNCFFYNNLPFLLNSGEFHYFRSLKGLWRDRLEKMRQGFCNTVASVIPWSIHELIPGDFEFAGSEYKDLRYFIGLIDKLHMFFIPRVGPYIGSELSGGGHPGWLLDKNIQFYGMDCRLFRTHDPNYMRYSELWYSHLNSILTRYDIENGDLGRNILLYQIEDASSTEEVKLHKFLEKTVIKQFGDHIPIFTNENQAIRETKIFDSINQFPESWGDRERGDSILKLRKEQPDFPPVAIKVKTSGSNRFGLLDENDQYLYNKDKDLKWTAYFIRELLIDGINSLNYYMYQGGINWEYSACKMGTSINDSGAPINEWGGLNDRWYKIKIIGSILKSFRDFIAELYPIQPDKFPFSYKIFNQKQSIFSSKMKKDVVVKARLTRTENNGIIDMKKGFIFIGFFGHGKNDKDDHIKVRITGNNQVQFDEVLLTRKNAKLLPLSVPVNIWAEIEFSTVEPYLKIQNKFGSTDSTVILFHGSLELKEQASIYLIIKNPFPSNVNHDDVIIKTEHTSVINLRVTHKFIENGNTVYKPSEEMIRINIKSTINKEDQFIIIRISRKNNEQGFDKSIPIRRLVIGIINSQRAERTWVLDKKAGNKYEKRNFGKFAVPIMTDLKFIRKSFLTMKDSDADLFTEAISGFDIDIETKNCTSLISIPLGGVLSPKELKKIKKNEINSFGCQIVEHEFSHGSLLNTFKIKPKWDIGENSEHIIVNKHFNPKKDQLRQNKKSIGLKKVSEEVPLNHNWNVIMGLDHLLLEDRIISGSNLDKNLNKNLWTECNPFVGFELNGFYNNGHGIFRGYFNLSAEMFDLLSITSMWLTIPHVSDICWVFLNGFYVGKVIGFGSLLLSDEIFNSLDKNPENIKVILYVESFGRTDHGRMEKSGILSSIYLDFAGEGIRLRKKARKVEKAEEWHQIFPKRLWPGAKPPMGKPYLEKIPLINWDLYLKKGTILEEINEENPFIQMSFNPYKSKINRKNWSQIKVGNNKHMGLKSNIIGNNMTMVYRNEFNIPGEWMGSAVALEIENFCGSYWVYLNGKEITSGCYEHDLTQNLLISPLNVNITNHLNYDAVNIIALFVISGEKSAGISGDAFITRHDYSLDNGGELRIKWFGHKGTLGETFGYHKYSKKPENYGEYYEEPTMEFEYEPVLELNEINKRENLELQTKKGKKLF